MVLGGSDAGAAGEGLAQSKSRHFHDLPELTVQPGRRVIFETCSRASNAWAPDRLSDTRHHHYASMTADEIAFATGNLQINGSYEFGTEIALIRLYKTLY